ncbi:MAG: hypothetical protein ACON35_02535 [Candidatus Marinamargulisbacteria bacterium]
MRVGNLIKTAFVGVSALTSQGPATPKSHKTIFENITTITNGALEFTSLTDMGTCIFEDAKYCETVRTDVRGKVLACASQGNSKEKELKECYVKKAHAHYADLMGKTMENTNGVEFKNLTTDEQLLFNFYMNFFDDKILK